MTVFSSIQTALGKLKDVELENPVWELRVIAAHVLHKSPSELYQTRDISFSPQEKENFFSLVARRSLGEPLQYVIGQWDFFGRTFVTSPEALIPRPETELLVEQVTKLNLPAGARVLDVGTGTGVIGITLALEMPQVFVTGTDLSQAALKVAIKNRTVLKAGNFALSAGYLTHHIKGQFHVITANLPYIPSDEIDTLPEEVRNFEPRLALDGGADGIFLILELVRCASRLLIPGGFIILETGYDQEDKVVGLFPAALWTDITAHSDLAGNHRFVSAVRRTSGFSG